MAIIGGINRLKVKRTRDYGAHLDGGESRDILLPAREVPRGCQTGDEVEVFVYPDREDRLRATTQEPRLMVGQYGVLKVVANTASGAYLDWGLPLDLFVPKSEQRERMAVGKSYVVYVFLDHETKRITASTKLDKYLDRTPPNYPEGSEVDLLIYEKTELGYKAVVNRRYGGMLYGSEVFQPLSSGRQLRGYIKKIRDDGKLDLSLQPPGYQGVEELARTILETIKARGGRIGVTDKSPPAEIHALFGVSKNLFKMAIGALYKKRLITIGPKAISLSN
jgi:predicted RNA-binding protein (virulence factor B family)